MPRPIRVAYTIPYGAQFGAIRAGGARRHQGCDYHCPIGTPIYGTGDGGVVVARGYQPDPNSGAGNYITINYPNHRTTDMHMREASPLPNGAHVGPTTIIGYVGLTGNAVNASPPGSHDHHQLTVGGILTDPEAFYGTSTAGSGTPITLTRKTPTMYLKYDTKGAGYLFTDAGFTILTGQEWELFKRLIRANVEGDFANPTVDPFLAGEMTIIAAAIRRTNPAPATVSSAPIDYAALAKAVNDDAAKRLAQ